MSDRTPQPGLLSVFKLYLFLRLVVIISSGAIFFYLYGFSLRINLIPQIALFIGDIVFLFVFLSWPWLQRRLGGAYLPIALAVSAMVPIVEARYLYVLYGDENTARLWLVFPFLAVPLILTAWQYEFRHVMLYCIGSAAFELVVAVLYIRPGLHDVLPEVAIIAARTLLFVLIGYIVSELVTEQRRQRLELARANRKLVHYATTLEQLTISRERNRLARELHDTLAHTLSGLAVQLDAIATLWTDIPPRASRMLDGALDTTRLGLDETRRALRDLRAAPVEDLGLPLALRSLAENLAKREGLVLTMEIPDDPLRLRPETEHVYYRVAQEALANVANHANARHVEVSLRTQDGRLVLSVTDDGHGFATEDTQSDYQFGLRGMRERAELVGGELQIVTGPDKGTTVTLRTEVEP